MTEKIPAENSPSSDRPISNLHIAFIDPSWLNEALVTSGASSEENPSCETEGRRAHKGHSFATKMAGRVTRGGGAPQ